MALASYQFSSYDDFLNHIVAGSMTELHYLAIYAICSFSMMVSFPVTLNQTEEFKFFKNLVVRQICMQKLARV